MSSRTRHQTPLDALSFVRRQSKSLKLGDPLATPSPSIDNCSLFPQLEPLVVPYRVSVLQQKRHMRL